jgi:hypothetical protein
VNAIVLPAHSGLGCIEPTSTVYKTSNVADQAGTPRWLERRPDLFFEFVRELLRNAVGKRVGEHQHVRVAIVIRRTRSDSAAPQAG